VTGVGRSADDLRPLLTDVVTTLWPGSRTTVRDLRQLTGGASRETWSLTADTHDAGEVGLIARLAGGADDYAAPLELEASAMRSARSTGVPVPFVHAVGRDDRLGLDYMLMQRCEGETIPRRILRDPGLADVRPRLARRLGEIVAQIHAAAPANDAAYRTLEQPLNGLVRDLGRGIPPPAGLALGLRWLRDHPPPARPTTLVHGDVRMGNLMIGPEGIAAVLDWELCHLGNPVEDLGWLCAKVWRFGSPLPVAGVGDREDLLDGYQSVAGWRPGSEELGWWERFGTLKWGLMCGVMAERHLSGAERSVELAAIGRRSAEQEYDVLLELGHLEADGPSDPSGTPAGADLPTELFGVPRATDLLHGVHHYLTTGPMRDQGAVGYHARVAANLVEVVRRELAVPPEVGRRHREALAALGCGGEAELSEAILDGSLDDRWDEVLAVVRDAVRVRLEVANPRHLRPVSR
jgi:aminoglycoside phosphotransferase (APT) family kinase protein